MLRGYPVYGFTADVSTARTLYRRTAATPMTRCGPLRILLSHARGQACSCLSRRFGAEIGTARRSKTRTITIKKNFSTADQSNAQ